jgi:hypothetical protein
MHFLTLHYFPVAVPFLLLLLFLFALLIFLIEIGILEYTYEKLGINRRRSDEPRQNSGPRSSHRFYRRSRDL